MTPMRGALLGVLAGLLIAGRAEATDGGWTHSFTAAAVGSYFGSERPAVLVAAAGVEREARAAAAALIAGLRASGRASRVMDSAALGPVEALSDAAVVKVAAALPVQVIAVVRVFPGADAPMAVATFYDRKGRTLSAMSVAKGAPLAPRGGGAGRGVSQEAAAAVSQVLIRRTKTKPQVDPREVQYRLRRVGFNRLAVVQLQGGLITARGGTPYRGNPLNPLDPAAFYEAVGRPDHAAFYRARSRLRTGLVIPGIVLLLTAPAMAIAGGLGYPRGPCREQSPYGSCLTRADGGARAVMWSGVVGTAVGLGALITAGVLRTHPTAEDENYRLAAEHNRKLRRELGLPDLKGIDVPSNVRARAPRPRVVVTPVLATSGGGLAVQGTFR